MQVILKNFSGDSWSQFENRPFGRERFAPRAFGRTSAGSWQRSQLGMGSHTDLEHAEHDMLKPIRRLVFGRIRGLI